ncbi:MAG: hypothetical protein RIB58_13870 [Phycisphaerales bacterium]
MERCPASLDRARLARIAVLLGGSVVLALLMFVLPSERDAFGLPGDATSYPFGFMIVALATGLFIADAPERNWLTILRAPVLALLWLILVMVLATAAHFAMLAF